MRKVLIPLLLASAAASPALAQRPDWSDRQAARAERQEARAERQSAHEQRSSQSDTQNAPRPERAERAERVEQRSYDRQSYQPQQSVERHLQSYQPQQSVERRSQSYQPQQSVERRSQSDFGNSGGRAIERSVEAYRARQQAVPSNRQDRLEQRAERLQQLRDNRELRQSDRQLPRVLRTRTPVVSDVPRPGTQPPLRVEQNRSPIQWSSNWRHNDKYDWENYRRKHRSIFHLGFYYDPFGWGYNPFQIGWRMWPNYYRSSFWINDPWYYRLPYAPPGTRWIRYYDDAILVDTWSGQVIDVIYDFFW